ncbi:hypothetical protein ABZP36_022646 [Zizania latifolia]
MAATNYLFALAIACLLLVSLPGLSRCDDHNVDDPRRGRDLAEECKPSGTLRPTTSHSCEDCCKAGKSYPTYRCSPPTSSSTKAVMTLNDFDVGGDGGDPSECDGKFHENTERVVALSTGWYAKGRRCNKNIRINAKGRSVLAKVIDECDLPARLRQGARLPAAVPPQRRRRVQGRLGRARHHRRRGRRVQYHLVRRMRSIDRSVWFWSIQTPRRDHVTDE